MVIRPPRLHLFAGAVVLVLAALLRCFDLGGKPVHADEAVHAWKVAELIETGSHRYDPEEYHGPTLHYLGAGLAWVAGERNAVSLELATLRTIPAVAGVLLVLLTLCLSPAIGRVGAFAGATWCAVSPLLVYYSRHFVQEQLFVLFTVATLAAGWYWLRRGSNAWAVAAGGAFGLLIATKETWLIVAAAMAPALLVAAGGPAVVWGWLRIPSHRTGAALFAASAVLVSVAVYTSFGTQLSVLPDLWHGLVTGAGRSSGGVHDKPWSAYAHPLLWARSGGRWWTEAGVAVFALAALPVALARTARTGDSGGPEVRFFSVFTLALLLIYTLIPYKTIWLACGFWHGATILAGVGVAALVGGDRPHVVRLTAGALALAAVAHLGLQAARATGPLAASPRNPYAYVSTSTDIERLHPRLEALAAQHPDGRGMTIKVAMEEYWPLPWLLRDFPRTGYWFETPGDWDAGVLLVSPEIYEQIPSELAAGLAFEFFGLRDGVIVVLATERTLWERSFPVR